MYKSFSESIAECKRLADISSSDQEMVILDIGCAIGDFVKLIDESNRTTPKKYMAIGVDPLITLYRERNLGDSYSLYKQLYEAVVSEKEGFVEINVNSAMPDLSSLKTINLNVLKELPPIYNFVKETYDEKNNTKLQRPSMTLGTICKQENIQRIDILKLDTQGNEYEILASINKKLLSKTALIYVETSVPLKPCLYNDQKTFKEILQLLEKSNFKLLGVFGLDDLITFEDSIDINCIFVNKSIFRD